MMVGDSKENKCLNSILVVIKKYKSIYSFSFLGPALATFPMALSNIKLISNRNKRNSSSIFPLVKDNNKKREKCF